MTKYGSGKDFSTAAMLKAHLFTTIPEPKGNLTGRVALISGATSGLGYATAVHFARLGIETLVWPVRSIKKGEQYAQSLHKEVPTFRGDIKLLELDLNRLASVAPFVQNLEKQVDRLDFAVLNAGAARTKYVKSPDGYEETIQINVLATGLLATLLLPLLGKTATLPQPKSAVPPDLKPQLEIVASDVHYWARNDLLPRSGNIIDELTSEPFFKKLPYAEMYNISKLLDVFIARKLATTPAAKNIQVTSTNPGLCKSGLRDDFGAVAAWLINLISWSAEFGTRTFLHAVLEPHPSGSYLSNGVNQPTSTYSCSDEGVRFEDQFFTELVALYGKVASESKTILSGAA